jgi:hypothetical protein
MAADSTMFLMVNLLIALSLGVHREQLEQRMGLTWPRPFLLRPLYSSQLAVLPHRALIEGTFRFFLQRVRRICLLGCSLLDHDGLIL